MDRRTFLKKSGNAGIITFITPSSIVHALRQTPESTLEESFKNPPNITKPYTWWHWMNGNITKEGITLDLEAMKRVGVGGVQCFNVGTGIPKGPVDYLSPQWVELTKHAISEAGRLDMEFDMHNCPGWSSTGGPWITPEMAMQQLVWSETVVEGGKQVKLKLPKPFSKFDFYRDVHVIAFPSLVGEKQSMQQLLANASSNSGAVDTSLFTSPDLANSVVIKPANAGTPGYLLLEFKEPYEAKAVSVYCAPVTANDPVTVKSIAANSIVLESSEDGISFTKIADIRLLKGNNIEIPAISNFDAVQAKYFRILVPQAMRIAGVRLSSASRIAHWTSKANFPGTGGPGNSLTAISTSQPTLALSAEEIINPASVINLTAFMDNEGQLKWEAPAGKWTILRMGHTAIDRKNNAPPDSGTGLECDKYSREAYGFHFNKMFESLLPALKAIAPKSKAGLLIDSYEVGMQNWTEAMAQQFQNRRGYDLTNYLPALTGRAVGSLDTTERFLWDFRKTCADLMADNYHGYLAELCKKNGLFSYTEPYVNGPFEEMEVGSRMDVNMGEFWIRGPNFLPSVKLAASIAHVYGKRIGERSIVGAESFTGDAIHSKWQEYPYAMKAQGDLAYTKGLNRFIFHRYAHQPHPTARPGMTMGPFGFHFDRTNTWFEKSKPWLEYAARCQNLLQQGVFIGDLLYFTSDDVPGEDFALMFGADPEPPQGYDFDYINHTPLLTRVHISNNRIVLPDGATYRVLVLPAKKTMTIEVLRKLDELVNKGMVLVGSAPLQTPNLQNHEANDKELKRLVRRIWGDVNSTESLDRRVGDGRVFQNMPLQKVLEQLNIERDFEFTSRSGDAPINFIHRRINNTDIYFVANRSRNREEIVASFRTAGQTPEFWHAETGQITPVKIFEIASGRTKIPLSFDPAGSFFIVFRSPIKANAFNSIEKDGKVIVSTNSFPIPKAGRYPNVTNNFSISVWVKPETEENFNGLFALRRGIASNVFYPVEGEIVYGQNHVTCGLVAARNGLMVYERATGTPINMQTVLMPLSGWTHLALVYSNGQPLLYVNGKLVKEGKASGNIVHPGLGEEQQDRLSWFFEGERTEPELFTEVLIEERIQRLVDKGLPQPEQPFTVQPATGLKSQFLFWQNGNYVFRNNKGQNMPIQIIDAEKSVDLSSEWSIVFPPNSGAPAQISLPKLLSLKNHPDDGVKYFSGTATYKKRFIVTDMPTGNKRWYLDLGRVEVMADVTLNGKFVGSIWKPPYVIDLSKELKTGDNELTIEVTTLWPNRLIGDEQLPVENEYGNQGSSSASGPIRKLPDWFIEQKPKPAGGRVTFTTWKFYHKDSPLLESGLLGPVVLRSCVCQTINQLG